MALIGDYNLAAVQVTVGDFRVTGWGPDDAVTVVPLSDLLEHVVSADGSHVSVSRINDPRHEATLTVRRNTAAFRLLSDAMFAQVVESDAGAVTALSFQILDPISGDKIVEKGARFMREPDMAFAKSQGDAEFKLLLPNPQLTFGANISVSA